MNDVQSLLPFVPRVALSRFLPEDGQPQRPHAEWLSAAVLMVDLAGYSELVERLSEEGSRGAERTQEILNRIFGPLASLIEDAGGEILRFPGDAALALFTDPTSTSATASVRRASAAALEAILRLDGSRVHDDVVVRLRVAIGAGPVWAAALGGVDDRFELLVRGAAVHQIEAALALAEPGEVVLSPEAVAVAGDTVGGERRGYALRLDSVEAPAITWPREPVAPDAGAVAAFVPRAVRARLAAGQRDFLAELRRVSVVFVNLRDLDATAPDALDRLQAAFVAVQEAVAHYGGSVNQVVDDEKGTVFLLGFGVAMHAHEDDGQRATLAALRIREELERQGLDPRIGVTRGTVFTGWRGSEERAEYALIGSAVNLAARLMQKADPILCDADTHSLSHERVAFEPVPPMKLKGLANPVAAFRPLSMDESARRSGPESALIGRDSEREILEGHLDRLASGGEGEVAVLEGEPGVGKTYLMQHLVAAARQRSIGTLVGSGDAVERRTPLLAWKPIVSGLFGAFDALDEFTVRRRLVDLVGEESVDALPVLNPVLPVRLPETVLAQQISPQARAEMIRSLLRRLLAATAERAPLLVVLDEGHWMDSASWEIAETAGEVPGVLVLVCMRPLTERPPACARLLEDPATAVVRLHAIDAAGTAAIACGQLGVNSLPDGVASFIYRRAEGHPLFIQELTLALRNSGHLEIRGSEARLVASPEELDALEFPETVHGLVRSRIDALEPEHQLTLKVAAIFGRRFEVDGLAAVHPLTHQSELLEQQLRGMVNAGLLQPDAESPGAWDFRHALIREAAYELLPYGLRREFHLKTAQWLDRGSEHDPHRTHAALGHHYQLAGETELAIEHFTAAGNHAVELWDNTEVVHLFERVIRLDNELDDSVGRDEVEVASRERKLGEALCNLGNLDRGIPLLRMALKRLGQPVPERQSVMVVGLAARLLRLMVRPPRPAVRSVLNDREARRVAETVAAVMPLGAAAYSRGTIVASTYLTLRTMSVAQRLGPSSELADVYVGISNIAAMVHRMGIARAYSAQGIEMAEREDDLRALGASLCAGQLFEVAVGNFDAEESIERGAEILAKIGEIYRWHAGALMVAHLKMMRGDFESSARHASEVLANAREQKAVVRQLWALSALADCWLRLGRLDEAVDVARETLELSETIAATDHVAAGKAAGVLAGALLRRDGQPPPIDLLEAGESHMAEGGWVSYSPGSDFMGLAEGRLAHITAGEGDRSEHLGRLQELAGLLKRTVFLRPVARSMQLWLQGQIDWHSGRQRRGLRRLRKAIASADRYRLPFEGARFRTDFARKLSLDAPERHALLSATEASFAAIGAGWEAAEVGRLKG